MCLSASLVGLGADENANGLHNNVCIVVPEWNMVVTRTNGGRKDGAANCPPNVDEIWSGFFARLAEAIAPSRVRSACTPTIRTVSYGAASRRS